MICSSNAPVTGSKLFHVDCHDDSVVEIIEPLGQTACNAAHKIRAFPMGQTACDAAHKRIAFHLCKESHDIAEQDDHQDVHGVRVEKMCIGVVTEEDKLRELFEHEEHGHEEDSGGVVFLGKGIRSLPWSDGENGNLLNQDR